RRRGDGIAEQGRRTAGGRAEAQEHVDEGGLSRAVLPYQGHARPGGNFQGKGTYPGASSVIQFQTPAGDRDRGGGHKRSVSRRSSTRAVSSPSESSHSNSLQVCSALSKPEALYR